MPTKKTVSYNRRTIADKTELTNEILGVIGIGKSGARSITDIVQTTSIIAFKKPLSSKDIVKYRAKIDADSEKVFNQALDRIRDQNFKKEVVRIVKHQLSEKEPGFTRVKREGVFYYYWKTRQVKEEALAQFDMSASRALAFHFIQKHLHLMLPPHIYQSLTFDFDKAHQRLRNSDSLDAFTKKIDFNPLGYDSVSQIDPGEFNEDELAKWHDIFSFTFAEKTFNAHYNSIHPDYDGKILTLSPQKIVLLNQQMMVLAYEHTNKAMKFFEIERLSKVKEGLVSFYKVETHEYKSKHKVKAICHTWVKHYAESVWLGENQSCIETEHKDCWQLEAEVWFPKHFYDNVATPDPFFFANFLGLFGDAIAIIEPIFLKEEISRRASQVYHYHSGQLSAYEMVSKSPKNMAKQLEP